MMLLLSTPPKADIFHMFFASLSGPIPSITTLAHPPTAVPATPGPGMMPPFNFMMSSWMMLPFGYPQMPNNSFYPPPKSPRCCESRYLQDEMPSSDPPDEDLKSLYPLITDFLQ